MYGKVGRTPIASLSAASTVSGMIKAETLNSTYEIDHAQHRVRRVAGANPATPNQGQDGDWSDYAEIGPVEIGVPLVFFWFGESDARKMTTTSPVVRKFDTN